MDRNVWPDIQRAIATPYGTAPVHHLSYTYINLLLDLIGQLGDAGLLLWRH